MIKTSSHNETSYETLHYDPLRCKNDNPLCIGISRQL